MEYFVVCLTAFLASGLTLFSGFGLGTILMPVLAIFFPVSMAVAATAVVHLANNLFKGVLVGRSVNKRVLFQFGVPAVLAAFAGAFLLKVVSSFAPVASYELAGHTHEITLIKLLVGLIIIVFSCLELIPSFSQMTVDPKFLPLGGLLSGFFGGLSGNQGALRSMFLIKTGIAKEEFIATNVAIAVVVDMARLLVYGSAMYVIHWQETGGLVVAASIAAFLGAFFGVKLIKKVTLRSIQVLVGILLVLLGLGLSTGLI